MDKHDRITMFAYKIWTLVIGIVIMTGGASAKVTLDDRDTSFGRQRRSSHCEQKYETITDGHSACLYPSSGVKEKGLQPGEAQVIVDIHNTVRREVSPAATNMMFMSWDDEIANTAQRWAENCVIDHDKNYKRYAFGRFSVGQNLAWGTPKMTWTEAIKLWSDEKKDFHFGGTPTGVVGHYTQMVWATTSKVGCGYANCDGTHYYVCDYGPGGNSGNANIPYKSGVTCSDCSANCNQGLCYCRNIDVCLNGGTLDFDTCSCSCKNDLSFYLQPNCGLNCTDIKEPFYCGTQWDKSYCLKYSNVPQECPNLCGWCPTAGVGAKDKVSSAQSFHHTSPGAICFLLMYFMIYCHVKH